MGHMEKYDKFKLEFILEGDIFSHMVILLEARESLGFALELQQKGK